MNCAYCGSLLPKSTIKGGRKREFCNDACKNRRYRQYKQEKREADMLEDPIWEKKYRELYVAFVQFGTKTKEHVQKLEERLKESEKENEELRESRDYRKRLYENLRDDYEVRMKAQGFSKEQIEEFNTYWQEQQNSGPAHIESLYKSDDKAKIQELEQEIQQFRIEVGRIRNEGVWQAKRMAELEVENNRLKGLLDERKGTSLW